MNKVAKQMLLAQFKRRSVRDCNSLIRLACELRECGLIIEAMKIERIIAKLQDWINQ